MSSKTDYGWLCPLIWIPSYHLFFSIIGDIVRLISLCTMKPESCDEASKWAPAWFLNVLRVNYLVTSTTQSYLKFWRIITGKTIVWMLWEGQWIPLNNNSKRGNPYLTSLPCPPKHGMSFCLLVSFTVSFIGQNFNSLVRFISRYFIWAWSWGRHCV